MQKFSRSDIDRKAFVWHAASAHNGFYIAVKYSLENEYNIFYRCHALKVEYSSKCHFFSKRFNFWWVHFDEVHIVLFYIILFPNQVTTLIERWITSNMFHQIHFVPFTGKNEVVLSQQVGVDCGILQFHAKPYDNCLRTGCEKLLVCDHCLCHKSCEHQTL